MASDLIPTELHEALARWEAGDLTGDRLATRFPDDDVAGILAMFEDLQVAGTGSTPDPAEAWRALRERLPVRSSTAGNDRITLIELPQEA